MALFGGKRDACLINRLNQELINNIVDVEVGFYKFVPEDTRINIYGEADVKAYFFPVLIHCLVERDTQAYDSAEFGSNLLQPAKFSFLRNKLVDINIHPEVGDIVEWDNEYYEIDGLEQNEYWAGKNPSVGFEDDSHGYNVSIICNAHHTRTTLVNIIDNRAGNNIQNNTPGDSD